MFVCRALLETLELMASRDSLDNLVKMECLEKEDKMELM